MLASIGEHDAYRVAFKVVPEFLHTLTSHQAFQIQPAPRHRASSAGSGDGSNLARRPPWPVRRDTARPLFVWQIAAMSHLRHACQNCASQLLRDISLMAYFL